MDKISIAQYGTSHGHAGGKMRAMLNDPSVEVAGVYEPDPVKRRACEGSEGYLGVRFYTTAEELLSDRTIDAVASEGANDESLGQTEQIVAAGKHVWYDKPAGDDWEQCQRVFASARESGLQIQMGYMLRYHPAFRQVSEWARGGMLGQVFSIRAHMSTWLDEPARERISVHAGGIHFDLAGHMLDQVVWILGRPVKVTPFLRNDSGQVPKFRDNTLVVYEFENAIAFIDIAAMETRPMARRFEVYGTRGSAIITEPFEPGTSIRLCLDEGRAGYDQGEQVVSVEALGRLDLYSLELRSFLAAIRGERPPDRTLEHELLVQEALLAASLNRR
jgi:predicted dehydrogenase